MIKGRQLNRTKADCIQLVFHRQMPDKPDHADVMQWKAWFSSQPKNYKIEKPVGWWKAVWPKTKDAVNRTIAKGLDEVIIPESRIWVRIIEDEICISIYSQDVDSHKDQVSGPYHPGCLTDYARIPIQYWNDRIEDITDDLQLLFWN